MCMSGKRVVQRGAEAVLYVDGRGSLVKERVPKGYRIPELDEGIRKRRSRLEVRLLGKARRSGVPAPKAELADDCVIRMDYIYGQRLKDALNGMKPSERGDVAAKIGGMVANLHAANLVHGDLTTSNMIYKDRGVYLIDFGLGKVSHKVEDKATDLFLLWEAVRSTHFRISEGLWKKIINKYMQQYSNARDVLSRFGKIERRRRYK
jgi:Kae1-associated kinase Bud32